MTQIKLSSGQAERTKHFKEYWSKRKAREKNAKSSSRKSSSNDKSEYGKIAGTTKIKYPDGSIVYKKDGKVVQEINPQGHAVVRLDITKTKSGTIKSSRRPSGLEYSKLRSQQNYKSTRLKEQRQQLPSGYNYTSVDGMILRKKDKDLMKLRSNLLSQRAVRKLDTNKVYNLALQLMRKKPQTSNLLTKKQTKPLTLFQATEEAKRLLGKRNQGIYKESAKLTKIQLQTLKDLQKLPMLSPTQVKKMRELEKLSKTMTERSKQQQKITGFAERSLEKIPYVGSKNLPVTFMRKLASKLYEIPAGIVTTAYNTLPNTANIIKFYKLSDSDERAKVWKNTGKAFISGYDPRTMDGLVNVVITVAMLGFGVRGALKNKALKTQISKGSVKGGSATIKAVPKLSKPQIKAQLSLTKKLTVLKSKLTNLNAKIKLLKVKSRTNPSLLKSVRTLKLQKSKLTTQFNKMELNLKNLKGNSLASPEFSEVTIKGHLDLPTIKKYGFRLPGRKVPFEYKQIIKTNALSKGVLTGGKSSFTSNGLITFFEKSMKRSLKGFKIKKVQIETPKSIKLTQKGTSTPLKRALGKEIDKVLIRTKNSKIFTDSKNILELSAKNKKMIISKVKNLDVQKGLTKFNFESITKNAKYLKKDALFLKQLNTAMKQTSKSILNKLNSGKLTTFQVKLLSSRLKNLSSNVLNKFVDVGKKISTVKMLKYKKGSVALPRSTGLPKGFGKDFTELSKRTDALLKLVEQTTKRTTSKQLLNLKSSPKGIITKNINLSPVFGKFLTLAKNSLTPLMIPLSLQSSAINNVALLLSKTSQIGGIKTKLNLDIFPNVGVNVLPLIDAGYVPSAVNEVKSTISTKPLKPLPTDPLATIFPGTSIPALSRFIPFVGGLPIPSKGGQNLFTLPLSKISTSQSYRYSSDLASKFLNIHATAKEKELLLKKGRLFTGLESRKLI